MPDGSGGAALRGRGACRPRTRGAPHHRGGLEASRSASTGTGPTVPAGQPARRGRAG